MTVLELVILTSVCLDKMLILSRHQCSKLLFKALNQVALFRGWRDVLARPQTRRQEASILKSKLLVSRQKL
jgi:hypothetical protein